MIGSQWESNMNTVDEEHISSENTHSDNIVDDEVPSTFSQTVEQI